MQRVNDPLARLCPLNGSDVKGRGIGTASDEVGHRDHPPRPAAAKRSSHLRASAAVMRALGGLALVTMLAACIVEEHRADDSAIEFGELMNIGYVCGGPAQFSWTVSNRQTSEQGTAGCEQPIRFVHLAPNALYTFDVTGYDGDRVCWQGSCNVDTRDQTLTFADCSGQIAHLCGL
jgi:hypothetical protein